MRFMMMLPAPPDVLETWQPTKEVVGAMRKFSDDMRKAGVLISAEGFHPASKGTRIRVPAENAPSPMALSPKPRKSSQASG